MNRTIDRREVFRLRLRIFWLAVSTLAAGCQADWNANQNPNWWRQDKPSPPANRATTQAIDPSQDRLGELVGPLMLYYRARGELPHRLEDLTIVQQGLQFTCPKSGKPYVYNRDGLKVRGANMWVLAYDPVPCQPGSRWVIVADPFGPGVPLVARVQLMRDSLIFGQPAAHK